MPSIKSFKPLTAIHYEAGWKHYLHTGIIELSAYYKRRNKLLAFRPNSFIEDSRWDKYMMAGNGESYGVNLYMFNQWRKLSWQLSYGFSKSKEWYAELPQFGKIPSLFDLPHNFNAFVSYKMLNIPHSQLALQSILVNSHTIRFMAMKTIDLKHSVRSAIQHDTE